MRKRVVKLAVVCIVLLWLPTAAVLAKTGPGRDFTPKERALIVREAYASLTRFVAAGGETIRFDVENLQTIEANDFGSVLWLDVVTMPGGDQVTMSRKARRAASGADIVAYQAGWSLGREDWVAATGANVAAMTVAEVLAIVAKENPAVATVRLLTVYDVTVHLREHSRAYKASVLWLPPRRGGDANLIFLDNVTEAIEEALREPPARVQPRVLEPVFAMTKASCQEETRTVPYSRRIGDPSDHYYGEHFAELDVQYVCRCRANCTADCESQIQRSDCDDTGGVPDTTPATFTCHKKGTNLQVSDTPSFDGRSTAASCQVGLGCVFKRCSFCSCSIGVTVNFGGGTATFSSSGDPNWHLNIGPDKVTCRLCTEEPPPPPPPSDPPPIYEQQEPNPGGGSGGGGSASNCCYWQRNASSGCTSSGYSGDCTVWYTCMQWGC